MGDDRHTRSEIENEELREGSGYRTVTLNDLQHEGTSAQLEDCHGIQTHNLSTILWLKV